MLWGAAFRRYAATRNGKGFCSMGMSKRTGDIISIVIMVVLSVILIPVLAINLTLIIKGSAEKDVPPDVFGIAPLAVTTGSMSGENDDSFDEGALIFVRILDDDEKNSLQEGDIVTFRVDETYVTHRIVAINRNAQSEVETVVTQGDANNVSDGAVPIGNVVGKCVGSVAGLGEFSMFLRTPGGILVFVGIPVLLFIGYDVLRIVLYNRRVKAEESAGENAAALKERESELEKARSELRDQEEELRRLRAMVQGNGEAQSAPAAEKADGGGAQNEQSDT